MNGTSELRGMDIDASGRLHVVGRAQNQNIPVTTPGGASSWGFVGGTGDYNTLLARFNANNQLEWCTTYPAGVGHDVVCTSDGFTVSGIGRSGMPTIDPGVPAYYQPASGGNGDALLMRFSTNALCTWATFFGGDGDDLPGQNGLAANTYGDVYFVGNTTSTTAFPLVGANDMSNANGEDGFIARIAAGTQALTWCSYANGKLEAVTTDPDNNVYAAGTTTDPNFPILFSEDLYNSGTLLSYHDGCILGFTATNTQFYGTFFGGESTPVQEGIVGIQYTLNRLLVASTVRKEMVTDYQPLYFPDFIAYYDDYYDFELGQFGLNTNTLDGHFASICRFVVGWEEHPTRSDGRFVVQHMADEQFRWSGLVDGTYDWNLLDASGRLLNTGKLTAHGEPGTFRCPTPADGLYLVTMRSGKQMFTARTVVTR